MAKLWYQILTGLLLIQTYARAYWTFAPPWLTIIQVANIRPLPPWIHGRLAIFAAIPPWIRRPHPMNIDRFVIDGFKSQQIVPDIIPIAPNENLIVQFISGVEATQGNELAPTQTQDVPYLNWNAENGAFYTICMINPDIPTRENRKLGELKHWLIVNIPGNLVKRGEVLSDYVPVGPPKDSGLHRVVFLVYKQPHRIIFDELRLSSIEVGDRFRFSVSKFADKYCLGDPVAGNFFLAQHDGYSPPLDRYLGDVNKFLEMS